MFGELVIAYLFLAGVGAGGVTAASLIDLLAVREPLGLAATVDFAEKSPAARLVALVLVASCVTMALGAACLALDLGRLDRVAALFFSPPTTLMNVGAWAVALLTAASAMLVLVRVLYLPWASRRAVTVLEVFSIVLAVAVAAYVGLLLATLAGVRLWSTFWVPVLFMLSAASCGCALVMAASLFMEDDGVVANLVKQAARVDAVCIAAEALAAGFFLAFVLGSEHPGVRASAESLMAGSAALPWWGGFMALGVVVPLAVETTCLMHQRWTGQAAACSVAALALVGVFVLVGAAGLRTAVVEAGEQRGLELQEPVEALDEPRDPATGLDNEREDVGAWLS